MAKKSIILTSLFLISIFYFLFSIFHFQFPSPSYADLIINGGGGGGQPPPPPPEQINPNPAFNCAVQACPVGQCCTPSNGGCGSCSGSGTPLTLSCDNASYDAANQFFNVQVSPGTCANFFGHPVVEAVGVDPTQDSSHRLVERLFNYPLSFCPIGTTVSCSLTSGPRWDLIREPAPNGQTDFGYVYTYTCTPNNPNNCIPNWNVNQPLPDQLNDNYSYQLYFIAQSDLWACNSNMCSSNTQYIKNTPPQATITCPASPVAVGQTVSLTVNATDADNNLDKEGIYFSPTTAQNWSRLNSDGSLGSDLTPNIGLSGGSRTITATWRPTANDANKTFYVVPQIYDSGGGKCTSNPWGNPAGFVNCSNPPVLKKSCNITDCTHLAIESIENLSRSSLCSLWRYGFVIKHQSRLLVFTYIPILPQSTQRTRRKKTTIGKLCDLCASAVNFGQSPDGSV